MDVTVLTYNIHKAIGNDRRFDPDRIARVCEAEGADVVALQEVDNGVPRSQKLDLAAALGERLGFHYRLGSNVSLKIGTYGNATLSRWPFHHGENLDLTWTIKKRRGCLNEIVETPAGPLAVMNFHLGLSRIERHFQLRTIMGCDFLKNYHFVPTVLLGDSNERTRYLDIFLRTAGFRNSTARPTLRNKTWPSFAPIWNLDKIFLNQHVELVHYEVVKNELTRVASDHLPVKARIRLKHPKH